MSDEPIVIRDKKIEPDELSRLVHLFFGDMVKYVVDIERGIAAVGGEMHSDAEALLLEHGSLQDNLWGANYYPGLGRADCIQFTSLINIRPSQGNRSMDVMDDGVKAKIRELTYGLIGEGDSLE